MNRGRHYLVHMLISAVRIRNWSKKQENVWGQYRQIMGTITR